MKTLRLALTLLGALGLAAPLSVRAADGQPPGRMSFQGFLTSGSGEPLGNTTPENKTVLFRLYKSATGIADTDKLWAEKQVVTLDKGHFSVLLGEGAPTGVAGDPANNADLSSYFASGDASERYLGVQVEGQPEIAPRIQYLASPFAFLAKYATQLVQPGGAQSLVSDANQITASLQLQVPKLGIGGIPNAPLAVFAKDGDLSISTAGRINANGGFSGNGSLLTSLDASKITTGTVAGDRIAASLPGDRTFTDRVGIGQGPNTPLSVWSVEPTSGISISAAGRISALSFSGNGAGLTGLTGLNASQLTSGTIPDARIGGTIGGDKVFSGKLTMAQHVGIGGDANAPLAVFSQVAVDGGNTSISASGFVRAAGYITQSDVRLKEVIGVSDAGVDLETLRRLEVADYRLARGNAGNADEQKGFIAQQVEAVLPMAVKRDRNAIPSVDAAPASMIFDPATAELTLTLSKVHGLQLSDCVRIFADSMVRDLKVSRVVSDKTFVLGALGERPSRVHVYGRLVDDFRSVDYQRIFVMGISAIQELARRTEALETSQARMTALEAKAARVDALERDLAELRQQVSLLAGARKGVAEGETLVAGGVLPGSTR